MFKSQTGQPALNNFFFAKELFSIQYSNLDPPLKKVWFVGIGVGGVFDKETSAFCINISLCSAVLKFNAWDSVYSRLPMQWMC